jgi:predicted acylesterase/phospholipase RssA
MTLSGESRPARTVDGEREKERPVSASISQLRQRLVRESRTAFVLSGGGNQAVAQVGMLRALIERGILPEVIVGCSAGAFNGATIAASPDLSGIERLEATWDSLKGDEVFPGGRLSRAWNLLTRDDHLFSNQGLRAIFRRGDTPASFEDLVIPLRVVAADLDTGEEVVFARGALEPALLASSALPGLFPPVEIDDRYFVDGALKKTMHASVALDDGVDLMLCLNPLVPFDATPPLQSAVMPRDRRRIPRIVDGGLPAVLSQTFRSMIHSRMELGMKHYERAYPATDIVLIEPDHRDPELYLANTFSYGQRRALAEHAYQQTRAALRSRRASLGATLARHGISLRADVLDDASRRLVTPSQESTRRAGAAASLHEVLDELARAIHPPTRA